MLSKYHRDYIAILWLAGYNVTQVEDAFKSLSDDLEPTVRKEEGVSLTEVRSHYLDLVAKQCYTSIHITNEGASYDRIPTR